jgi:hypothetical protein
MRGLAYRGLVTRATTAGVWLRIDGRWPGIEFGPCPIVANIVRIDAQATTTTAVGDHGTHGHTVPAATWLPDLVQAGDRVLVIDTGREDFVVVGVLREGVSD